VTASQEVQRPASYSLVYEIGRTGMNGAQVVGVWDSGLVSSLGIVDRTASGASIDCP
jgi:hypothetical protein